MTAVEDWAVGLCSAAIGLSVIMLIVPSGRMKKTVSVLAGVCYFSCLIAPVSEWCRTGVALFGNGFPETTVSQKMLELTDEQIDRVIEEALAADARSRLDGCNVTVHDARIERESSPQDGVYIHRVILSTAGEPLSRDMCKLLELSWGVEVEVVMIDE